MRTIQMTGFLTALLALLLGFGFVSLTYPGISASAAGGIGFLFLTTVLPLLGLSAILLVPSSLYLLKRKVREASDISGKVWKAVWYFNLTLSSIYSVTAFLLAVWYVRFTFGS
ncbi:hypothetical protein [Rheinheimera soli]|uniref:hypothetical protein n=1 Tax=Rheinheimera soli TaxID=443616 RepID=UPI001E2B639A|nr:hypothetical protein [Rheinheimera soli]